jgi:DNA gyrase/topoisomerase IV subunit A
MSTPKYRPQDLGQLYKSKQLEQEKIEQDKKILEALRRRLEDKIKDPQTAKKAAVIIESWIHSSKSK